MNHHARRAFLLLFLLLLAGAFGAAGNASAQGGRYLDPRLPALGVSLVEAQPTAGELYWRIERVEYRNEAEAQGRHALDVEMLDEAGRRMIGARARVSWQSGATEITIEDKPPGEYGANFPMYAAGCSYNLEGIGYRSDRLNCLGLGDETRRQWNIHVQYRVTFRLVRAGGSPGATPTATAAPLGWRLDIVRTWPNCGLTRIMGRVVDGAGRGLAGHRVDLTWEQPGAATYTTPTNALGEWEFSLKDRPHSPGLPGWRVMIFDPAGREIVRGHVMTDPEGVGNCAPGGDARNVVEVLVRPVPAPITATPMLPLPTSTPGGYPAPPTPPATATVPGYPAPGTATPTAAPAPTVGPGTPGGKAIYTGFPDNVTLLFECAEGEPVAAPVPPQGPPLGYELRCEAP